MPNWLLCWQTVFLFSFPVSAVSNTYLMHHTCAPTPYTCLYVASIVHFRHISCKIEGENYHATFAIFKRNRALPNLLHPDRAAK